MDGSTPIYQLTYPNGKVVKHSLIALTLIAWGNDSRIVTVDDFTFILLDEADFDYTRDPVSDTNSYPSVSDATDVYENPEPLTPVIFRMWSIDGNTELIALFPSIPADTNGKYCMAFQHVGQHGGADYQMIMDNSRTATPAEYADLKYELESSPYNYRLCVFTRRQTAHDRQFARELNRFLNIK